MALVILFVHKNKHSCNHSIKYGNMQGWRKQLVTGGSRPETASVVGCILPHSRHVSQTIQFESVDLELGFEWRFRSVHEVVAVDAVSSHLPQKSNYV